MRAVQGATLVIGAGSNLGGRTSILRMARALVEAAFESTVRAAPVWDTAPLGPVQPRYLNTAFAVAFDGDLHDALDRCRTVEISLGRVRRERWGPRTLDLDLLWHSHRSVHSETLDVPHPGLRERTFALDPLLALVRDEALAVVRAAMPATDGRAALGERFETSRDALRSLRVHASDRCDLVAAALEAALVAFDTAPAVEASRAFEIGVKHGRSDAAPARITDVLRAAQDVLAQRGLRLHRAAVLAADDDLTRVVLLGSRGPADGADALVCTGVRDVDDGVEAIVASQPR